jgi:hypothetical protein
MPEKRSMDPMDPSSSSSSTAIVGIDAKRQKMNEMVLATQQGNKIVQAVRTI